ncbi:hypothetical protein O5558_20325 [Escherichia coli]|nr:hypothetical protein [Escherichia coli]
MGLYLTGHPINQYLKEIERYVGGVRLKDMHPTERGKVITAAGRSLLPRGSWSLSAAIVSVSARWMTVPAAGSDVVY